MQININKRYKNLVEVLLIFLAYQLFWFFYYNFLGKIWPSDAIGNYRIVLHFTQAACFCIAAFLIFPFFLKNKRNFFFFVSIILSLLLFMAAFKEIQGLLYHPLFNFLTVRTYGSKTASVPQWNTYYLSGFVSALTYNFLGIGYAFAKDWFIKDRQTLVLEKEKIISELSLLRNQLNPHFLFNTINDIYYLAIIKSENTADALLKLSDLLRYVLKEKNEWVSLDKEILYLHKFIELHQFRFPNNYILLNNEASEQAEEYQIQPMLLITFIENVFKHGELGIKEHPAKISLTIKNDTLHYEVVNKIAAGISKNEESGIGLPNLKKRLQLIYPKMHKINSTIVEDNYIASLEIKMK